METESTHFWFKRCIYIMYMQPMFSHVLPGQKWLTRGTEDVKVRQKDSSWFITPEGNRLKQSFLQQLIFCTSFTLKTMKMLQLNNTESFLMHLYSNDKHNLERDL